MPKFLSLQEITRRATKNKIIIFLGIILAVLLLPKISWAATYYVDYVDGADTNNGISSLTPFQHSPGDGNGTRCVNNCQSTTIGAGDTVYFKRGVTYIGQITIGRSGTQQTSGSNGNVTDNGVFNSEGQSFSSTVVAGDWLYIYNSEAGQTGKFLNSIGLWKVYSVDSNIQLTLLDFNASAYNGGDLTYIITRPISFDSTASFGTGIATISGDNTYAHMFATYGYSYLRFANLTFINQKPPTGYPGPTCSGTVSSACIYDWARSLNGIILDSLIFTDDYRAVNLASGGTGYSVVRNCVITNYAYPITGLGGSYNLFENNSLSTGGLGTGVGNYGVIRNNTFQDSRSPNEICGSHSDAIGPIHGTSYGWIYNNRITDMIEGIYFTYLNNGNSYWSIINNLLIGMWGQPNGSGEGAIILYDSDHFNIYNNTIFGVGNKNGWLRGIWLGQNAGSKGSPNNTVKNNIVYSLGADIYLGTENAASDSGTVWDYNIIYTPNNLDSMDKAGVAKTWSQWQAAGYDTHGSNSAPSFVQPAGIDPTALNLKMNSNDTVAKNTGTTGILFFDLENISKPQGSAWDIGAYEYVQAAMPPDTAPPAPPSGLAVI